MAEIVIRFDVAGLAPAHTDPLEIAEALLDCYTSERDARPDMVYFEPANNHLEAEWEDPQ